MPRLHPALSTAVWSAWNVAAEALPKRSGEPRMLLRYEDFTRDPRGETERILAFAGHDAAVSFTGERTVAMQPNHTVSGNPARFETGEVEIREDRAWRDKAAPATRRWATLLGWPLGLTHLPSG